METALCRSCGRTFYAESALLDVCGGCARAPAPPATDPAGQSEETKVLEKTCARCGLEASHSRTCDYLLALVEVSEVAKDLWALRNEDGFDKAVVLHDRMTEALAELDRASGGKP